MRRSLAAALLGVSLWIGSLAWSGFVMTRTVLDPGRSHDVADALLEDDAVRAQLEANIAGGVAAALPPGASVDRAAIDAGAQTALRSPAVEALFRDALVRTHQAFLGEGDAPREIDGGAFGASARDALVAERPELAGVVPEAPTLGVPLPTENVPNLGPVREFLLTAVPILASVAALGASLALFVTTNRPAVIRRAGVWAIGLSALVLAVALGVPALAHEFAPDQAAVVAALVSALAESTRGPALALAGAGAAGVVLSLLWRPTASALSAGPAPPPAGRAARDVRLPPRRDLPKPPRRRPVTPVGSTPSPRRAPVAAPSVSADATAVHPPSGHDPTRVHRAAAEAEPSGGAGADRSAARWVEGVGWVHEGQAPIPAGARWVPGVGYVLEDDRGGAG